MLKKKMVFDAQRQEQQSIFFILILDDVFASMSFGSESVSNMSQNSMLSEATSLNESKGFREKAVVGKYCDLRRWRKNGDVKMSRKLNK